MNRYFDTHAHYNDPRFEEDLQEVLRGILEAGIAETAVIGYDMASSLRGVRLAEGSGTGNAAGIDTGADAGESAETGEGSGEAAGRNGIGLRHVAAVGIHPLHTGEAEEEDLIRLEILAEDPVVRAIGEIGLDYHKKDREMSVDRELQQYFFRKQIRIARRANLPVVIHSRDAAQDTLEILEEEKASEVGGVIHCYSYSPEMAVRFTGLGFYLGIGGVVTYPASRTLRETVQKIPMERLVLETDAPYLPIEGHRGERNDSRSLPEIAEAIASLLHISVEEVCRVTRENAYRLYRMDPDGMI